MGAGKTTVGRLLAESWGVAFRDTDSDIEVMAGKSLSDLFVDDGEAHARALERKAVAAAVAEHEGVLSLGGGAILAEETRERLAGLPVVFLRVGLSAAVSRVGMGSGRPLLFGNVRARVKLLMEERDPIYRAVATVTVDTDDKEPAAVAAEVRAALEALEGTHE
jgi:shikimate kinase